MSRHGDTVKKGAFARMLAAMRRSPESGVRENESDTFVLLVDGNCAMCRGIARFAAKRDRAERLRFAAQDSAAGRELTARLGLALPPGGSFALVRGSASWTRSAAAIRTLAALDGPWPAAAVALRLVPARLRDAVYDTIAARRHRIAGRMGARCPAVPDERLRRRLLAGGGWAGQDGDAAAAVEQSESLTAEVGEGAAAMQTAEALTAGVGQVAAVLPIVEALTAGVGQGAEAMRAAETRGQLRTDKARGRQRAAGAGRPIYVEIDIASDMEALWRHTQQPKLHERWDLRFSEIDYLPKATPKDDQHFLYLTRIGFGRSIRGTGKSRAPDVAADGVRTSVLAFGTDHPLSLIGRGGGYWRYTPLPAGGVRFVTRFDYRPRFGRAGRWLDRLLFRPLFGWATAWSFDALRLWLDRGVPPEESLLRAKLHALSIAVLSLCWAYAGLVPKLLYPVASGELDLLRALGWFPGFEPAFISALGVGELLVAGIVALRRSPKLLAAQAIAVCALTAVALAGTPGLLYAPFNPLVLAMLMLAATFAARWTYKGLPSANRCRRQPGNRNEKTTIKGEHA
ncbi:DCC1-like thiol-disulfide oxidoreductase family protein [Cohnella sp. GCM10012308]|uniref:DCC1-like thiol-disulfide oxidoreductase family protein n=1 Tax=Cohnella sp. GCM10012308 TaxID=3317329 RepID=UPI003619AB98